MSSHFRKEATDRIEKAKKMKEEDKLYRYKGILYPVLMAPEENLKTLEGMEARPDDIVLVAYPKCGFNWMMRVLHKVMAAAGVGDKDLSDMRRAPLLEFTDPDKQKVLSQDPSPRLYGMHLHPDNIPTSFFEKKAKILVVFRNPKDAAVSYYHFTNNNAVLPTAESWDTFYEEFMRGDVPWGSYFDHAQAWEKHIGDPNVMIVTFEDLKQDLGDQIHKISKFFGFTLSEEQIQNITQESTFSSMKESSKSTHGQMVNVFFRKGEVGDWKNNFSDAQSEEMDAAFEKHLAGTKLGAMLNYDVYCK